MGSYDNLMDYYVFSNFLEHLTDSKEDLIDYDKTTSTQEPPYSYGHIHALIEAANEVDTEFSTILDETWCHLSKTKDILIEPLYDMATLTRDAMQNL